MKLRIGELSLWARERETVGSLECPTRQRLEDEAAGERQISVNQMFNGRSSRWKRYRFSGVQGLLEFKRRNLYRSQVSATFHNLTRTKPSSRCDQQKCG